MSVEIALTMIMRNEAENLVRCLDAAKQIVQSVFLIDTGSIDGTQEIARKWGKEKEVPVVIYEEQWENFKVNRSSLLRRAAPTTDWMLMLDVDMVIHVPDPFPSLETADCWHGRVGFSGLDYTLPMFIRSGKPWSYEGVAHSYLACDEEFNEAELKGLWVEDYSHTGPEKLRRDLEALSAEHARNPLHPRTTFYLAQTYFDLDMISEAIQFYRSRAYMDNGWDEETYYASYRLGCLLCEHVSYLQGARELLRAWEMRPSRAEALRVLGSISNNVADKIPYPVDRLFVHKSAYAQPPVVQDSVPPFPSLDPGTRRAPRVRKGSLLPSDVSAIVVTRGNVDLTPVLDALPYKDVVVWNNADRPHNYKTFGRYAAISETKNPVLFWVDDDVVFTAHDELLAAYEPGKVVANMDQTWVEGASYDDLLVLMGAGSLCDAHLPAEVFNRYLAIYPWDDDIIVECDFAFGVLVPWKRVDLGYGVRPFADDPDRLYNQPGQTQRKWRMINRCKEMLPVEKQELLNEKEV